MVLQSYLKNIIDGNIDSALLMGLERRRGLIAY